MMMFVNGKHRKQKNKFLAGRIRMSAVRTIDQFFG